MNFPRSGLVQMSGYKRERAYHPYNITISISNFDHVMTHELERSNSWVDARHADTCLIALLVSIDCYKRNTIILYVASIHRGAIHGKGNWNHLSVYIIQMRVVSSPLPFPSIQIAPPTPPAFSNSATALLPAVSTSSPKNLIR